MWAFVKQAVAEDDTHIESLFLAVNKRQRLMKEAKDPKSWMVPAMTTLNHCDETVRVDTLAQLSGYTSDTLIKAKKLNTEVDKQMIIYGLGVAGSARFPKEASSKIVFMRWTSKRDVIMGKRLRQLFVNKAISPTSGGLDWAWGAYRPKWGAPKTEGAPPSLIKIGHCSGDEVEIPDWAAHITLDYEFMDNFSDFGAFFHKEPAPKVFIHTLFEKTKKGPYKVEGLFVKGGKDEKVHAEIVDMYNVWKQEVAGSTAASSSSTATALEQMRRQSASESTKANSTAIAKAALTKKKRRSVKAAP